ncbi:MAG: methyltransferase domain-containing protein [Planctomycetota bacterium]|nr:methyltransferase domain-containing protein [Planctomycetota bacterium]
MKKTADNALYRFGVSMEERLVKSFDEFVTASGYRNRSEAIRDLVRKRLSNIRGTRRTGVVAAIASVFYSRMFSRVTERLGALRSSYSSVIKGEMDIPLRGNSCLQVFGLLGEASVVRELEQRASSIEGVQHVETVNAPFEALSDFSPRPSDVPLHESNPLHSFLDDGGSLDDETDTAYLQTTLDEFSLRGKAALDAGCGTGRGTLALYERVQPDGRVIGVDFSAAALEKARERLGNRVELRHEDLLALTLPAASVDFVLCNNTFSTILDQSAFLRRMRHILRPTGLILVVERGRSSSDEFSVPVPSRSNLSRMFSASGFLLHRLESNGNTLVLGSTPGPGERAIRNDFSKARPKEE